MTQRANSVKNVLLITILSLAPAMIQSDAATSNSLNTSLNAELAVATPLSVEAAAGPQHTVNLNDHYGNPDRFIQYIIRVPPVHA